jgi:hypothetical protein
MIAMSDFNIVAGRGAGLAHKCEVAQAQTKVDLFSRETTQDFYSLTCCDEQSRIRDRNYSLKLITITQR